MWCWGPGAGGLSLAQVPALQGVTGLVPAGPGVCGIRGEEVVCHPERPASSARLLSHDGYMRCVVESSGDVRCRNNPVRTGRRRVVSVLYDERHCSGAPIILFDDGRVSAEGCDDDWHRSLRDVVQIEGTGGLFCARTRAGEIACENLEGRSGLEPTVLGSFDGRRGYTDLAVLDHSVCALDASGVVSCASPEASGQPLAGPRPGHVHALPQTGVRAIAFDGNSLCLLDDAGVLCDGVGTNMLGVAVEVVGLPPVRSASLTTIPGAGCAIDREDALWCWEERAPARLRDHVRAVALFEGMMITLDSAGILLARGRRGAGVALPAFWPGAPPEVSLSVRGIGDSTVVCASLADEVRCAEVRLHGVLPEALVVIDAPTDEQRAITLWRNAASELDEHGRWGFRDYRWGRNHLVHLRDDIVWTMAGQVGSDALAGIDSNGRLWVTARRLEDGIAGGVGRRGSWIRLPMSG